jgi:hypothetical protein
MRTLLKRFMPWLPLLFAVCAGVVIGRHELWRDELQAWLLARDTPTFTSFLYALRYEGVPPLWHTLIRGLTRVSGSPSAMQLLQVLLGTAWVKIMVLKSPFPRWLTALLAFSYYVFYQYTIISRSYGLGLIFLTLACADFHNPIKTWRLGLWLALASWTSVMGLIVAAGIAIAHGITSKRSQALLITFIAAGVSVFLMIQPQDALFPSSPGWIFNFKAARLLHLGETIVTAYLPAPAPNVHFWENPWVRHLPGFGIWRGLAGLLILVKLGFVLRSNKAALITFGVSTLGLLLFSYLRYIGYARHQGFYFFAFLFALWIGCTDESRTLTLHRPLQIILGLLLGFQVYGTAVAAVQDFRHPFTCGRAVACYLMESGLDKDMLAAGPDYLGVPVAGYLHQPYYSAQGNRWQTYTRWDLARIELFDDREFIRRARMEAQRFQKDIVMMINYPMDPAIQQAAHAELMRTFTGSIVGDEDYYLYRIGRKS